MKFPWIKRRSEPWTPTRMSEDEWRATYYGDHHQAERLKYAETLQEHGGQCVERLCVMESRRIEPSAPWQLAHDHKRGPRDYLGPAHPESNEFEAHMRWVFLNGPRLRASTARN